jgi:solute carrier family 25 iron transporter 28/37
MNVPFQAAVVSTYSLCQSVLNPRKEYSPSVHFAAGAVAGAVASTITMPLDVCKTLLNTQEAQVLKIIQQSEIVGMRGAARVVYQLTGAGGFFQGLTARVLYQAPSTAVAWSVYEFFKYYLREVHGLGVESLPPPPTGGAVFIPPP